MLKGELTRDMSPWTTVTQGPGREAVAIEALASSSTGKEINRRRVSSVSLGDVLEPRAEPGVEPKFEQTSA